MNKYLKWNHPAVPSKGIIVDRVYELDELLKLFKLDEIKTIFKPENFEWESEIKNKNIISKVEEKQEKL